MQSYERGDRFTTLEEKYADYNVFDTNNERIGTVRKRVRTERERMYIPTKRERVPMREEAPEGHIGEDEVSIPVVENEIVVNEGGIEEDLRKEEVDIEDDTKRGQGSL